MTSQVNQDSPNQEAQNQANQEQPNPPIRFELIPEQLYATISLNEVQQGELSFGCWTYISDGLKSLGQKEIVFILEKKNDEADNAYPTMVLNLIATMWNRALNGILTNEGDLLEIGEGGFIEPQFTAVAFQHPFGLTGLGDEDLYLIVNLLTKEETEVAKQFGLSRVVALQGFKYNHFPSPPWIVRDREPVVNEEQKLEMLKSIVAKVPFFHVRGFRLKLTADTIHLECRKDQKELLKETLKQLPMEAPFAMASEICYESDAILTWQQDMSNGPTAISKPGSQGGPDAVMSGCFMTVIPEQEGNNLQVIEDGFLLSLETKKWEQIRNYMLTGKNGTVSMTPGDGKCVVDWYDPADAVTQLRLKILELLPTLENEEGNIKVTGANIVGDIKKVAEDIEPIFLRRLTEGVEATVMGYYTDREPEHDQKITLVMTLSPGPKVSWNFSAEPAADQMLMKGIELRLNELPLPEVTGEVKVEMVFEVGPKEE